ncbi:UNVERIFIED_CONTAM: hypothetical protein RMT77_010122 [Armadillidium vulgare]
MMLNKSSLVVIAILLLISSQCQSLEDYEAYSSDKSEGRSLFNSGFFRKIFRFFGWGDNNRKSSQEFPVYRRQEVLPYEIMNAPSRRSGFEPSPPDIPKQNDKRKWPYRKANRKKFQRKGVRGIFSRFFSPQKKITTLIPTATYKTPIRSYISTKRNYNVIDNYVDESIDLGNIKDVHFDDTNTRREFNTIKTKTSYQGPKLTSPKVESRDPIISVYRNGHKVEKKSPVKREKQDITNVHSNKGKLMSDKPFSKDNSNNIIKSSKSNLLSPSKNFYTKDKLVIKKNTYEPKNPVHPYPYVQPDEDLSKVNYNNFLTNREQDSFYPYAAPLTSDDRRRRKKKKERGLFKNMSNMASNFFGNIFSRSPSPATSSNPALYPLRRFQRNPPEKFIPPPIDTKHLQSPLNSKSSDTFKDKSSNAFDPSPQQGLVSSDAFQPIFVPSYSMDSKLPSDVMKPLILPQRRNSEVEVENTTTEPELIDFFS